MDHNYEKNGQAMLEIAGGLLDAGPSWLVIAGVGFGLLGAGLLIKAALKGPKTPERAATLKGSALSLDEASREAICEAFNTFYQSPSQPDLRIGPSKHPMSDLVRGFMAECALEAQGRGDARELKIQLLEDCTLEQYRQCCQLVEMLGGSLSVTDLQPITDYMTAGAAQGKKDGLPAYVVVRK